MNDATSTTECEQCGRTDGPFGEDVVTGETICAECAKRGHAILTGRGHSADVDE